MISPRRNAGRWGITLRRLAAGLLIAALVSGGGAPIEAAIIVRKAGGGGMAQMADALAKALDKRPVGGKTRVIELSGDTIADGARLVRESKGESVAFAIGPEATAAAGDMDNMRVVALAIPNPAKLKTEATCVSIYPKLDDVFDFLKEKLHARQVGFLFSAAQNAEVARAFTRVADAHGIVLFQLPVGSAAELGRTVKQAIPKVDVLVLAVDPIIFDRQNLKIIVSEALAAKKPTVGFLEGLPGLGVTVSLVADPTATAATAVDAAEGKGKPSFFKNMVDTASLIAIFSRKSADAIGINPEALGAQRIE